MNEERLTKDLIDSVMRQVSMRDLFAMHAVNGLLADERLRMSADDFAQMAYIMADAMLRARER